MWSPNSILLIHDGRSVKFTLEVDITEFGENAAVELSRILRYWAGNMRHFKIEPGDGSAVYDSEYREVGAWVITNSGQRA